MGKENVVKEADEGANVLDQPTNAQSSPAGRHAGRPRVSIFPELLAGEDWSMDKALLQNGVDLALQLERVANTLEAAAAPLLDILRVSTASGLTTHMEAVGRREAELYLWREKVPLVNFLRARRGLCKLKVFLEKACVGCPESAVDYLVEAMGRVPWLKLKPAGQLDRYKVELVGYGH